MNKYRYLNIQEAIELGHPDLRGTIKNGKFFKRYLIYKTTGNVVACWETRKDRQDHNKRNKKRAKKYQNIIARYKTFCGCRACGYNKNSVALHLNHKDPSTKRNSLSQIYKSWGWNRIKEEVKKCEVLCANCHAIHSYEKNHHMIGNTKVYD